MSASDNFRQAQPLALVAKRPMAVSLLAIDERAASLRSRPRLDTCPPVSPAGRAGRARSENCLATGPVDVPRTHQGMAVAYALLSERERLSVTPMRVGAYERVVKSLSASP